MSVFIRDVIHTEPYIIDNGAVDSAIITRFLVRRLVSYN